MTKKTIDPTRKGYASKKSGFESADRLPLPPPAGSVPMAPKELQEELKFDSESNIATAPVRKAAAEPPAVDRQTRMMAVGDFPAAEFVHAMNYMSRGMFQLVNAIHWLIGVLVANGILVIAYLLYNAYFKK